MKFDLFDETVTPDINWLPAWLSTTEAEDLRLSLDSEVSWKQDFLNVGGGVRVPLPRMTAWQGEKDAVYSYSGIRNMPAPWSACVLELKTRLEKEFLCPFNSVLLNRYRHGKDSISWHADDEPELGDEPVIASLSLGHARTFNLRHKKTRAQHSLRLTTGSLLIMKGSTQREWVHQVPKEPAVTGERINLTFRHVNPLPSLMPGVVGPV